ncbi:hypothetical protein Droror1_Dr00014605 [Drosera rotundifolia]
MGIPSTMRDAWIDNRRRNAIIIASPLEEKRVRDARHCTQEGVRAGARAAVVAAAVSAVPTDLTGLMAPRNKLPVAGCIVAFVLIIVVSVADGNKIDRKVLNVGKELYRETLPLRMGSRLYKLEGLKSSAWYELKISYPASIPAIFSMVLKRDDSDVELNTHRKLLNTEKLIFKAESSDANTHQGGMYVLVTVEPEGIVAIPGVPEREVILFNIVCDELLLGIPHKAWLVVIFAVLCLLFAFIVPLYLPSYLLPKEEKTHGSSKHRWKST